MRDLWGFLLQTLTASGVAALLLIVKSMFRDKLPPRWQFAVWGVLGAVLLLPAGLGGRYVLLNWPWYVETGKALLTGSPIPTRVVAPVPLPARTVPSDWAGWLYAVYVLGVLFMLARYLVNYIRLRRILRRGISADPAPVRAVAEAYHLPVCRAVEVPGLRSAMICGVFHPVLALPAGGKTDGKVILHELLHLQSRDVAWGLVIGLFRALHWCNPLLWYCAGRAGNDLEARCDQRVLEKLEGEERRDYGRILLSMVNETFARTPGTSSMANGGGNIRRRIEAIARFKQYPRGMALVSVCLLVMLAVPLLLGVRAGAVWKGDSAPRGQVALTAALASARTTPCTTPDGAMDAYAKAVLEKNGVYRAMCAPMGEQAELAGELNENLAGPEPRFDFYWEVGVPGYIDKSQGYYIYNLEPTEDGGREGLLAVQLSMLYREHDGEEDGYVDGVNSVWLGCQRIRAEKEEDRWVVRPREDFYAVRLLGWGYMPRFGCEELPGWRYEASAGDFTVRVLYQTGAYMDTYVREDGLLGQSQYYDTAPQPDGTFSLWDGQDVVAVYNGGEEGKADITHVGVSCAPVKEEGVRPPLRSVGQYSGGGSSTDGDYWAGQALSGDWEDEIRLGGGGGDGYPAAFLRPYAYAADLYINGKKTAELTLLPVEGGAQ